MVCHSVVYRNGTGVMNIQFAEEYKINVEKEEKERGFLESRSWGLREEGAWTLGARTREKESEPGAQTRKMESEPGPERRGMQ